ncbi:MAG: hypothetical protein AAF242_14305, partial [Bacteroidota bacterium]
KGKVERHIKIAKRLSRLDETILAPFNLSVGDDLTPIIEKIEGQEEQLLGGLEQIKSQDNLDRLTEKYRQEKETEEGNSRSIEQRVAEFQRLNYLLDCQFGIHNCDIYGRVEHKESGQTVATLEQERPVIESTVYEMDEQLQAIMPPEQFKAVQINLGEENGEQYVKSVLSPLEKQVQSIPRSQTGKNPMVHAHFFTSGTDWFITEWDGKDQLFGYVILNGDTQMSELGYSSLAEIHSINAELDFFWKEKLLDQALYDYDKSYFPRPIAKQTKAQSSKIESKASSTVDKIEIALKGLQTLKKVSKDKSKAQKIESAIKGLQTLKKLKVA